MKKIIQDNEGCIGCGACTAICPDFWEMNDEGKAILKGGDFDGDKSEYTLEIGDDKIGCNQEAVEVCPVQVIKITN